MCHQPTFTSVNSSPAGQNGHQFAATFSNAFLWMKTLVFWSEFEWCLSLRVQLTISDGKPLPEPSPEQYNDAIMSGMASQISSLTIVYSTVYSSADRRKYQSSASLAFVRGIHRWPGNSPHKRPVTRKMFPFDDVIIDPVHLCLYAALGGNAPKFSSRVWDVLLSCLRFMYLILSVSGITSFSWMYIMVLWRMK